MGYGTGIGIGGQSYDGNKIVNKKRTSNTDTNTFHNIHNPKENTNTPINTTPGHK